MDFSLEQLDRHIASRASASPELSYTAQLLSQGLQKCAQKLGEEAVEVVIAAVGGDKQATISEAGDVLYHLLVVLRAADISLDQVMEELSRRTAQSGLDEKAAR